MGRAYAFGSRRPKVPANTKPKHFRLLWVNESSRDFVLGWNCGANPETNKVYWDFKDQGEDLSKYSFSTSPQKVISFKGMKNCFYKWRQLPFSSKVFLRVSNDLGSSKKMWFSVLKKDFKGPLSLIMGGDSRNSRSVRQNANMIVSKVRPHGVLFGGDMTGSSKNSEWSNWFEDWDLTITYDGQLIPLIPARGNHEKSNEELEKLFFTPKNAYYTVNIGGDFLRVYTLNSEMSIGGAQSEWLRENLKSNGNSAYWLMAQYHKPMRPHNKGKKEGTNQYRYFAPLFFQYKFSLVMESDAHLSKITWPIRPFTGVGSDEGFIRDDALGTVYAGEGGWGAPVRSADDNKKWTLASGKFNQVKWLLVNSSKMELRTIFTQNAKQVTPLSESNRFTYPKNLKFWKTPQGEVVVIKKRK
jgi:acid phosphatase type 7